MAVTISNYDHTQYLLLARTGTTAEVDFTGLKVLLLNQTAAEAFDATDVTLADVIGGSGENEVYGNGWAQGGYTLQNVAATLVTTNDVIIDSDDPVETATGGPIGPAYGFVLVDQNDRPLQHVDFGEAVDAGEATDFLLIVSPNGWFRADYNLPS